MPGTRRWSPGFGARWWRRWNGFVIAGDPHDARSACRRNNREPVVNSATADAPNGLEQLRQRFFGDEPFTGIGKTLDFRPVELEAGRVVFEGHPDERFYNPIGSVH